MRIIRTEEQNKPHYTKKYVFEGKSEVSSIYIDRKNKDIICISSMYGCPVKCEFCKSGERYEGRLTHEEIIFMINHIVIDKKLGGKRIVFSFMGSGEPLLNTINIAKTINFISKKFVNYSVSISISGAGILNFKELINNIQIFPQIQFSLHSPFEDERRNLIPLTSSLDTILPILKNYDGNVEINYILLEKINDSNEHAKKLAELLKKYDFKLKINEYHKVNIKYSESKNKQIFIGKLMEESINPEIYATDGVEIGAACGQLI